MRTIQRDIVGAFIFSKDNKLLLGQSHEGGVYAGAWIIPGGGIDPDETKEDAVKREVLEETGIDISVAAIKLLDLNFRGESEKNLRGTGERVRVQMNFFNFTVHLNEIAEDVGLKTEDDFINARWVPTSELATITLSPPTITTLKKLGYL
jgi:8-oxo-dGTP pyrophosphatase MutT (NUDIX family)